MRKGTDPALDTIHPGDKITVSWDESCALIFGAAAPAIECEGKNT